MNVVMSGMGDPSLKYICCIQHALIEITFYEYNKFKETEDDTR